MEIQPHLIQGSSPFETKTFYPLQTVRCEGQALFRSQLARDAACLLDLDDHVKSWSCLSEVFRFKGENFRPDLIAEGEDGRTVIQAEDDSEALRPWVADAALAAGYKFHVVTRRDLPAIRLRNARDLLRYARYEVTLDDRIRVLAALDDHGSLTVGEIMSAFRGTPPIPGLANLVLARIVTIDIDDALIGPETVVRRYRG